MSEQKERSSLSDLRAHDHVVTISREEHDLQAQDIIIASDRIETLERENAELHDVLAATHSLLDQKTKTVLVLEAALASTKVQLEQKDRSLMALEAAHAELQQGLHDIELSEGRG